MECRRWCRTPMDTDTSPPFVVNFFLRPSFPTPFRALPVLPPSVPRTSRPPTHPLILSLAPRLNNASVYPFTGVNLRREKAEVVGVEPWGAEVKQSERPRPPGTLIGTRGGRPSPAQDCRSAVCVSAHISRACGDAARRTRTPHRRRKRKCAPNPLPPSLAVVARVHDALAIQTVPR